MTLDRGSSEVLAIVDDILNGNEVTEDEMRAVWDELNGTVEEMDPELYRALVDRRVLPEYESPAVYDIPVGAEPYVPDVTEGYSAITGSMASQGLGITRSTPFTTLMGSLPGGNSAVMLEAVNDYSRQTSQGSDPDNWNQDHTSPERQRWAGYQEKEDFLYALIGTDNRARDELMEINDMSEQELRQALSPTSTVAVKTGPYTGVHWSHTNFAQLYSKATYGYDPEFDENGNLIDLPALDQSKDDFEAKQNEALRKVGEFASTENADLAWLIDAGIDPLTARELTVTYDDGRLSLDTPGFTEKTGYSLSALSPAALQEAVATLQTQYPNLLPGEIKDLTDLSDPNVLLALDRAVTANPNAAKSVTSKLANFMDIRTIRIKGTPFKANEGAFAAGSSELSDKRTQRGESPAAPWREVQVSEGDYNSIQGQMGSWGSSLDSLISKFEVESIPWEIGIGLMQSVTNGWNQNYDKTGTILRTAENFAEQVKQYDSWVLAAVALRFGPAVARQLVEYGAVSPELAPVVGQFVDNVFETAGGLGYIGERTMMEVNAVTAMEPITVSDPAAVRETYRAAFSDLLLQDPTDAQLNAFASSIQQAEIDMRSPTNVFGSENSAFGSIQDPLNTAGMWFPVAWEGARIQDDFEEHRNSTHRHAGSDINAPRGSPVVAAWSGVVIQASRTYSGGGNMVKIRHHNGYGTSYMHLDTMAVRENDQVGGGTVIGTVGDTGTTSSYHLHFEVNDGSFPGPSMNPGGNGHLNPLSFLRQAQASGGRTLPPDRYEDMMRQSAIYPSGPGTGDYGDLDVPVTPGLIEDVNVAARAEEAVRDHPRFRYLYHRKPETSSAADYARQFQNFGSQTLGFQAPAESVEAGLRSGSISTMYGHILSNKDNLEESPLLRQRMFALARSLNSMVG